MPVRLPPVTEDAAQVLLDGIIDYAGLFPPASLSLREAVRNYAHYRAGGDGWMLGRFVCPASSLEEFSHVADPLLPRDAGAIPWRLTIVGSGDVKADALAIGGFNTRHRVCFDECSAIIDSYEARVDSVASVRSVSSHISRDLTTYLEIPATGDAAHLVAEIAEEGRRAKIRTGGITPELFPRAESVVAFLEACIANEVAAKATAGLHHALRGVHPLTYQTDSQLAPMFGFLNVFLCAAMLVAGASSHEAAAVLVESDGTNIEVNDLHIAWHGPDSVHLLDRALISQVRRNVLTSFGSCSFTEPVAESRQLGMQ